MRRYIKLLILLLYLLPGESLPGAGLSSQDLVGYLSPETIEGSTRIDSEGLIELAERIDKLVIIDSRIRADRKQGYIAGSVSLPDTQTSCETLQQQLPDKSSPVVFYCNGPKCRRSDRAIVIARDCGYKNLYWFRGGIEEWKNKNYLISK